MKTNKVFKWLYGVFMFLPMLAIGVTCAYVTFNKNAKDSYSDSFIQQSVEITNDQSYQLGANYQVNYVADTGTSYTNKIYFSKLSFNPVDYGFSNAYNYTFFRVRADGYMYLGDDVNTQQAQQVWGTSITSFTYTSSATPSGSNAWTNGSARFYLLTYKQNSLDNAFYYAVDQFNDSGFNKVDFVSYFDMFYNNTNIWTTFANTYFNYMLFVSLAFFIPRVLLWFINLAFAYSDGFERKSQRW